MSKRPAGRRLWDRLPALMMTAEKGKKTMNNDKIKGIFDGSTSFVIEVEVDGKYYAYADRIQNNNNLIAIFERKPTNGKIISVNVAKTATGAHQLANYWNECFKKNGTYYEF